MSNIDLIISVGLVIWVTIMFLATWDRLQKMNKQIYNNYDTILNRITDISCKMTDEHVRGGNDLINFIKSQKEKANERFR